MLHSGDLDRQIDLLAKGSTRDSFGEETGVFAAYASAVWASKRDLKNDERREGDQPVAMEVSEFRIYWRSDVKTTHRVRYPAGEGGTQYAITGIREIGRQAGLIITATAEVKT